MTYTPNVPLSNQTIAFTTDLIRNNFQYINTEQQKEHVFNGNLPGVDTGVHKLASMPNFSSFNPNPPNPPSLPTGTNGVYYVNGDLPRFRNSINDLAIPTGNIPTTVSSAIVALNQTFATAFTPPDNSCGQYFIYRVDDLSVWAMGSFLCNNANIVIKAFDDPDIQLQTSGKSLQARVVLGKQGNYIVIYTANQP